MFKNRRVLSYLLSLLLVVGVFFGIMGSESLADSKLKEIKIIHVNDVHGQVEGNDKDLIGYPRLKTYVDRQRKENPNLILLNAGDTIHGTNFATLSRGETVVNLMNMMGFDAMVPGNHDFNYGSDRLLELSKKAKFEILAANLVKEGSDEKVYKDYMIKEVAGIKLGIFGLATPETKEKSHPNNTKGIDFVSPVEISREMVKKLKSEKVDVIIALSHLGEDKESEFTSTLVAKEVEGIDVIVDGHSHTKLPEGRVEKGTLIVQTGDWVKNIGEVTLGFEDGKLIDKKAKLIGFDDVKNLEGDKGLIGEIEKINLENKKVLDTIIGKTKTDLNGVREIVRGKESNLGNFVTEAMKVKSGADLAITNGGGIRDSISAGDITIGQIHTVFPFTNFLVLIEASGQDIVDALEYGTDAYPEVAGKFPQVSGISYTLDVNEKVGTRVKDVLINGSPIDLKKTYKLATNDFMAAGGDGYTMFEGNKILSEDTTLADLLVEYLGEVKEIDYSVDGRLNIIETKEEDKTQVKAEPKDKVKEKLEIKPKYKNYKVVEGDVLWKIANKFNTTWENLRDINKLKNPHRIYPNQILLVP